MEIVRKHPLDYEKTFQFYSCNNSTSSCDVAQIWMSDTCACYVGRVVLLPEMKHSINQAS